MQHSEDNIIAMAKRAPQAANGARPPRPEDVRDQGIYRSFGLTDDEYGRVTVLLGRLPNYVETGIFSVMWSEHCSYKSSRRVLRQFPTAGPRVLQGPGENAGIVDIGDGMAAVFKIESHNHPTAIEPYQGAATGVGGIIRDIFTMGARPVALLDSLRFGPLSDAHNRYLFSHSVAGIGGYGNCIGIPTVGGEVVFDDCYTHNPLVNAMCVGVIAHGDIARGSARGVGNPVLVVGAKTGRDGIHGATFASVQDPHARERSAVQVGDPFMEKLLLEACLELIATGKVVGIQDMGAAGLTSSSAEMASRAGSGLTLDVAKVPRRESGMNAYEIMLSESQERMLVVMRRGEEEEAFRIFGKWGLEATVIGAVTDDGRLRVLDGDRLEADIPVAALVDEAPVLDRPARRPAYLDALQDAPPDLPWRIAAAAGEGAPDLRADLLALLAQPTIASKRWVYAQYDFMVRTETLVHPGADAAVVGVPDSGKALAMTTDGNGRAVQLDPWQGGALTVAEAARNLACVGAEPLALTDCLNYGNPEKPEVFYQFKESVRGMSDACCALGVPVISGNVSLYNESHGRDIFPTPVVGMVGLIEDAAGIATTALHRQGAALYVLGDLLAPLSDGIGGSEYLQLRAPEQVLHYCPPRLSLEREKTVQDACRALVREGAAAAAHDVADGGLLVAIAEMAIAGDVGVQVVLPVSEGDADARYAALAALCFGESPSRIVLEIAPGREQDAERTAAAHGAALTRIGFVASDRMVRLVAGGDALYTVLEAALDELAAAWREAIDRWMR